VRKLYLFLRACWRLVAVLLVTVFGMTRCALAMLWRGGSSPLAANHAGRWARASARAVGLRVERRGEKPPAGALVVANHRSYADIWAILSQTDCIFVAKQEVSRWPIVGLAARIGHTIFVDRRDVASRRRTIRQLKRLIEQGVNAVVFPEGTTTLAPNIRELKRGAFHLAASAGVPVVPVAVEYPAVEDGWVGDDTFIGHFLRRFGQRCPAVRICFGPRLQGSDGEALRVAAQVWMATTLGGQVLAYRREAGELADGSVRSGGQDEATYEILPNRVPVPAGQDFAGRAPE
jgi:1-acyl-sn-glycerol-3-phosphate acyltransferase